MLYIIRELRVVAKSEKENKFKTNVNKISMINYLFYWFVQLT